MHLLSKLSIRIIISFWVLALAASPLAIAQKQSDSPSGGQNEIVDVLSLPYSGAGVMPIEQAIRFIAPSITKVNYPPKINPKALVKWQSKGVVGDALTAILGPLNVEWSVSGTVLTIFQVEEAEKSMEPTKPLAASAKGVLALRKDKAATAEQPVSNKNEKVTKEATSFEDVARSEFRILPEDDTLFLALRRWAQAAGHQLVWDAGKDFPARATTYVANTFEDAVAKVMQDTSRSSFPLHACSYTNKVVRILHAAQSCERLTGE